MLAVNIQHNWMGLRCEAQFMELLTEADIVLLPS